jgi:hypothetical protein
MLPTLTYLERSKVPHYLVVGFRSSMGRRQ